MIKSFFSKKFILFLFVGSSCAIVNIVSRVIFDVWFGYSISVFMAFFIGLFLAFFLNFQYVFPSSNKPIFHQAKGFILTNLFFLPVIWLTSLILQKFFNTLSFITHPYLLAHILAVSIPIFFSFLIYKFSIFK